jgi:DivIVA domain-containing protein
MGQLLLIVVVALTVAAVVFGVTVLVSGGDSGLAPAEPDGRAVPLPATRPLREDDLGDVTFDTASRGYRMAQVDQALRRAAYDIGYKDELIGVLEAEVNALRDGRTLDADALRRAREAAQVPASGGTAGAVAEVAEVIEVLPEPGAATGDGLAIEAAALAAGPRGADDAPGPVAISPAEQAAADRGDEGPGPVAISPAEQAAADRGDEGPGPVAIWPAEQAAADGDESGSGAPPSATELGEPGEPAEDPQRLSGVPAVDAGAARGADTDAAPPVADGALSAPEGSAAAGSSAEASRPAGAARPARRDGEPGAGTSEREAADLPSQPAGDDVRDSR